MDTTTDGLGRRTALGVVGVLALLGVVDAARHGWAFEAVMPWVLIVLVVGGVLAFMHHLDQL